MLRNIFLILSISTLFTGCGGGGGSSSSGGGSSSGSSSSSSSSGAFVPGVAIGQSTFTNPLLPNGADPWLEYFEGNYYLLTTTWTSQLVMRKSPTLAGLSSAHPIYVWSDDRTDRCCNFWAFEMHRLNGPNGLRWYIMYTAGHAPNLDGQKLRVLESAGTNPLGPYTDKGTPLPNRWNIDGTYLEHEGSLYLLWSEWVGPNQSNWIAEMSNPWTVDVNTAVVISTPSLPWEIQGSRVNEAAVVLKRNDRTFVTYSASSCNTQFYKLGLLELTGSDPLVPASWTKFPDSVFQSANGVFGPGHNGFFKSPDGTEDWLIYHGNNLSTQGCGASRFTRAQPIAFDESDMPIFGQPIGSGVALDVPAGEMGPITANVQGAAFHIVNKEHDALNMCLGVDGNSTADAANSALQNCVDSGSAWVLDSTNDGFYRIVNNNSGKVLDVDCQTADDANAIQTAWVNKTCQQWEIVSTMDGWFRFVNRDSGKSLDVAECLVSGNAGTNIRQMTADDSACQQWRLAPVGLVAITNVNSGKVLETPSCDTADGANIHQWEYFATSACQKWMFQHTSDGFYHVRPDSAPTSCMVAAAGGITAGANVVQHQCAGVNSEFRIEPLADGTLRFMTRDSNHALDVASCGIGFGTNVVIWDWLNNDCQRFNLLPVN